MIFGRQTVQLGPYTGLTYPVSEGRIEKLAELTAKTNAEIEKIHEAQEKAGKPTETPRRIEAKYRKQRAEIMIEFDTVPEETFWLSKDFPVSVLHDVYDFFLKRGQRL